MITIDQKTIGEWAIDLAGTGLAFAVGAKLFMDAGVPVADQPIKFLMALAVGAVAFKVMRQWKAFK